LSYPRLICCVLNPKALHREPLCLYHTLYVIIPDGVGCFTGPRKIAPLKKFPESPETVGTTFMLFTRQNGTIKNHAATLNIDDVQIVSSGEGQQSILYSNFDTRRPVKIIIHGFRGSGKDRGALYGVDAFLNLVRNIEIAEN
jgi:hypothetical protein